MGVDSGSIIRPYYSPENLVRFLVLDLTSFFYMNTQALALERKVILPLAILALSFVSLVFVLPLRAQAALIGAQIEPGATSADVTSLQTFLAQDKAIYPEALITGYFGDLTKNAVMRFQTANGLSPVGRVGPATLALINARMGGGGTGGTDDSAPTIYPETVTTSNNSATISWSTSEGAKSRVMYGTTWPFLYATAPSVSTNGFSSTASITLTGLQSNTMYYYTLESVDGAGNVMLTLAKPLCTQQ
jgi:hypothetical protein